MHPTMIFLSTIISCILLMQENSAVDLLKKPVLQVLTRDPNDIMIGDAVQFHCKNWTKNAQKFYLMKDNGTREQDNPNFAIAELKMSDSGEYTCKYSLNTDSSQPSEPEYIYVKDKYPPPKITVMPRKIVRTGEDITIACDAPYSNIQYTIYKNFIPMEDSTDHPFSYIIRNAGQKDVGQYVCGFRTNSSSKTQIQSELSDPVMIQVKDFGRPSVSWEVYADVNQSIKIRCEAPAKKLQKKWFQLLNSSNDIEEEIMNVAENHVTFNISSPDHTQKKYYCIYAIRIGQNFALSAVSEPIVIWGDDYTTLNLIRLLLSVLVLILLGVILVKHFEVFQKTEETTPHLPLRRMQAAQSECTEMVIMKRETVKEDRLRTPAPDNEICSAGEK